MNRIIASSLAVALSCAPAFAFAQDRPADQQKNQSQSDASAAATGGERAEQARGEAGSNTSAAAGQSSDASSSSSSATSGGANRSAGATDAVGAGQSDSPARGSTDLAQPAAARDSATDAAAMQDPTKMFIMETYNSNMFEIQSSQLASQKVQDDKVKQHARMMIEDHTQANQQLKQVAQSAQVQLPTQLDAVHQAKLQKMQQIPASELGRKYMNSQVASHWMSVLEFRYQAKNAQNPQVKQFATQMLPKLEQHLQHAQQMAEQHAGGSEARTASERQPADTGTGAKSSQ